MTIRNFHEGELRLQSQTDMRDKIDVMTQHLMHNFMLGQHREFLRT